MEKNKVLFSFIHTGITVIVILLVVYFGVQLASIGYDFGYRVFTESAVDQAPGKDALIQVKEDMSEYDVAKLLEERGVIRDARLFFIQFKLSIYKGDAVPGVYTVNSSMTPQEIMATICPEPEEDTEEDGAPVIVEDTQMQEENPDDEFIADDDFVTDEEDTDNQSQETDEEAGEE